MEKALKYRKFAARILCILAALCATHFSLNAQSTSQSFPTPITSNEISGMIKARDIGDARLTNYFYFFNGTQGDIFINVVTKNLNGDIDIFNAENLNPLTKIVIYADSSSNETGRVIYLRKPEKLILRIQGRSPNDDAATYAIKFAGSFLPVTNLSEVEQPKPPEVQAENQSDVVVNSVGTIIGVKPTPTPTSAETIAKIEEKPKTEIEESVEDAISEKSDEETAESPENEKPPEKKVEVVVTENTSPPENPESIVKSEVEEKAENPETIVPENPKKRTRRSRTAARRANVPPKTAKPVEPNPLENVRLVVLFKDGSKIERPMSEVLRVNIDSKGMLTVISKDGSIGKYSILDVAKFSVE